MLSEVNPGWLGPGDYTAFLNRVFPGQWDLKAYDWYIARGFNGRRGDLLIQAQDCSIRSGFALVPRQIVVDDGAPIDAGIVCAAATLPEERGRGRYAQLLQAAIECGRQRGYVALLGFVTADNPSGRGLLRIGARAIPSYYILSPGRRHARAIPRERIDTRVTLDAVAAQVRQWCGRRSLRPGMPQAHFHYAERGDWERQFLYRPHAMRAVRVRHDCVALVESVRSTDRLQCLACPDDRTTASIAALAAASLDGGQSFFMYTLDASQAAAARRLGLKVREGYLLLLPTGHRSDRWDALAAARWHVQSGDRL
jgi:GNAT superfamily N-acetyltransferase